MLSGLRSLFFITMFKFCYLKNGLLIIVDRAYASFVVLFLFLKVVVFLAMLGVVVFDNVANVTMLEFVAIKVAQRIESVNVAN